MQFSINDWQTTSRLMITNEIFFSFLTTEVKCDNKALNIANRQNVYSVVVATNAVVELYKLMSRQDELNRKILIYSILHDNKVVRIYDHYSLIKRNSTVWHCDSIRKCYFTIKKERWISHMFTKNVYDDFYSIHHERICFVIDQLFNSEDFDVKSFSSQSDLEFFQQNNNQLIISYLQ